MNTQKGSMVLWVIGVLALAVVLFIVFRHKNEVVIPPPQGQVGGAQSEQIVIEGDVVCLPHRNTTGPTTLECTYGIKNDKGEYYGLDTSGLPATTPPDYQVGDHISVEGRLVPRSAGDESFWQTYNITGMLAVTDFWKYTEK